MFDALDIFRRVNTVFRMDELDVRSAVSSSMKQEM